MKNLKVKFKILVSFGIIIAMILAFSVFVIISNSSLSNTAYIMNYEMQMQAFGTNLVDSFSQANAGVNIINYSFDEREFTSVLTNISASQRTIQEMRNYIADHRELSDFKAAVDAVSAGVDAWSKNINDILSLSKDLEKIIDDAHNNQRVLTAQSAGVFDYQMDLLREEAGQSIDEAARLRRVTRIEQGVDISDRLNAIGASFELMFRSLDISNIKEDMAFFEETVEVLTEFRDGSALQYNIDTSEAMLVSLEAYRGNIDGFLSCYSRREDLTKAGASYSAAALKAVHVLVDEIEESSQKHVDNTINITSRLQLISITIVIVGIAVAAFLAFYISGLISKPLNTLSAFMKKAGETGDISLSNEDAVLIGRMSKIKDEIGEAINGSAAFVGHVTNISKELEAVAGGDLTADIKVLSNNDTMGISVKQMVDNLNNMFAEINTATVQVSSGSKQVADGAQALAQGSTEQAASIEELSSAISEVAVKTKTNATTADKTSKLSETIKENAVKGSRQMDEMITAVVQINEASKNISKIIKTIDDIAFQTNILALNAAVEAARAGQHGKGFAVVAEEVRNLASKSAEAAKDTGVMIQDSMAKAELGAKIAGETATSLKEIVSGVNESSRLIGEIANASEEQSMNIQHINVGIDQVAQVVQQNSATAEESAAVSEEMSGQSDMLQHLIAQFRLKESNLGLPPAGRKSGKRASAREATAYDLDDGANFGKY